MNDYDRIAKAILYLRDHFREQPALEEIARQVHVSPFHFQRLFKRWAGVSPKKFLQYISVQYAKDLLKNNASVLDASYESGLSGTGRLHDLFVSLEGMTPGEYKNGGEQLTIQYSFAESPFGDVIVASTGKGICHLSFVDSEKRGLDVLRRMFPGALFRQKLDLLQQNALRIFTDDWKNLDTVRLHLKGTAFQLKVWETLLRIPMGSLATYGSVGRAIDHPGASRAVGSAIGDNPVAFLIPCHRVIRSSGVVGEYHWGTVRKSAMIGWEAARSDKEYGRPTHASG
jgi:AraC family transcriptional regulator, regulatory protein of adaptative response / methylated-DNA-[protein]-cysteine methyltransferase